MAGCSTSTEESYADKQFTELFAIDSNGVTGADGCISFPLSDGSSVFMMGDSFLDPVVDGERDSTAVMINNTFIIVEPGEEKTESLYDRSMEQPRSLLTPIDGDQNQEWYWPGHGFEHKGVLHIFMSRFLKVTTGWGFASNGTDYLRLSLPDYKLISQDDFPYSLQNGVHWGHSLLHEEDYVYIYGTWHDEDYNTGIHVCRSRLDEVQNRLSDVEFHDGEKWNPDPLTSIPMAGIEKSAPEQFSLFLTGNTYVLVMQQRELYTGKIYSYISDSPSGPWRNEKLIYEPTEQLNEADKVYTYNAMAHPQYTKDNMLLVSYCVNSFEVRNVHKHPEYYRPRFFRVSLDKILN